MMMIIIIIIIIISISTIVLISYDKPAWKLVCFFQPHPEAFWNIIDWLSLFCAFAVLATYIRMEVEVAQSQLL